MTKRGDRTYRDRWERVFGASPEATRAALRWDPVFRLWLQGYHTAEIAPLVGFAAKYVRNYICEARRRGDSRALPPRHPTRLQERAARRLDDFVDPRPPTKATAYAHAVRWDPVLELWSRGLTGAEIAARTGVPRNSVLRIAQAARQRGDPRAVARGVPKTIQGQGKYS